MIAAHALHKANDPEMPEIQLLNALLDHDEKEPFRSRHRFCGQRG
jgi:hypothetical protein